jgi:pilus assembly protein Flp/PilA
MEPGETRRLFTRKVVMKRIVTNFLADQTAATAIEYALIAAGISIAIVAGVNGLGTTLGSKFTTVNTSLK